VAEEPDDKGAGKKRGPKGGIRHTPGRGHARKSQPSKKRRFGKRLKQRRRERAEEARKEWEQYDRLPDETKKLLGPAGMPKSPRPKDET
jgi:hypothetical protein